MQAAPIYSRLCTQNPAADFYQVDVDDNQEVTASCFRGQPNISLPTFKLYKGGNWLASVQQPHELAALVATHATPPTILTSDMEVTIFGLKSRPELNGRTAAVKRYDNQKQRYAVEVQGETVSMRRDNLCARCAVTVEAPSDGSEGAELPAAFSAAASTEASLCGYDPDAHAYSVQSGVAGDPVQVPVACCRVPDGATGLVCGLVGGAQYNGSQARVIRVDAASGRYEVALGGQFSGKQLKVKRANLRV